MLLSELPSGKQRQHMYDAFQSNDHFAKYSDYDDVSPTHVTVQDTIAHKVKAMIFTLRNNTTKPHTRYI